ncbi:MAG: hypothetical protein JWL93_2241 [Hyphomicrobiales bacterium]|nr:hypothetical protein [Hyphomicrobiales bacterium]
MLRVLTPPAAGRADLVRTGPWLTFAVALACLLALDGRLIWSVWQTGAFGDSDDAMRMVQVRDWMAGQAWFDLHAHRLGLPGGREMHWSRVVDAPVAGLIRLFGLAFAPEPAERLARIAFPLLLQIGLLGVVLRTALLLGGRAAAVPAVAILLASGFMFNQFMPGRIDHHAPQILLLACICFATLRALDAGAGFRWGLACGAAMSLSLAISIENLPMIAVAGGFFAACWAVDGAARRPALTGLAAGLLVGLPLLFAATVPPGSWLQASCDAFSGVYLALGVAAAAGCLALTLATPRGAAVRWLALVALGLALAALVLAAFPDCARDPYSAVDPVVRRLWLDEVIEARPLSLAIRQSPDLMLALLPSALLGLAGCLAAALRETGATQRRWAALALISAAAFVTTWWKVAALSGFLVIAGLGLVWPLLRLRARLLAHGEVAPRWIPLLVALAISPLGLTALLPSRPGDADRAVATPPACFAPEAYGALDRLPAGLVFGPLDLGAHLLAHTRHGVVAAPYHRNNAGNRLVLEAFAGDADAARDRVVASGADYVVACARAEDPSLAGRLARGDAPDWLTPLGEPGVIRIYRVAR